MTINTTRRKAVMTRSIKLGHCICNPKQGCPCQTFKDYNVCSCAGEKMPSRPQDIALTKHVRKAGCASKIGQADLLRILSKLPPVTDPNVIVGAAAGDDAGIYRIDDRFALVQTVDVFTPCVDNAYLFGQIAAANSVSDIYAMGGKPITALSVIGFPIDELDGSIMEAILRGGMDKLAEAGCSLIGGHSINDEEIKCGFAVTGLIDTNAIFEHDAIQPGDALVLTKPLGTGIVCFAAQLGRISGECLDEAGASMATLNRDAAELMAAFDGHACTDVTGYGLAGHLVEMVRDNGLMAEIDMSAIPVFASVGECIRNDILPGAIERNQEYSMAWVRVTGTGDSTYLPILYDPQTSGGLLVSLPEEKAGAFADEMRSRGHAAASVIGRIVEKEDSRSGVRVVVTNTELRNFFGKHGGLIMADKNDVTGTPRPDEPVRQAPPDSSCCENPPELECCPSPPAFTDETAADSLSLFNDFMKKVSGEGLIDRRTKKLMEIALSVAQRCKPCLIYHIKSARSMGITKPEIEEAAHLGVAFAGCPALTLYKEVCRELNV
ncbi:selenide, water dikinase SelD [bacterium]|nr:selenide, water dikinase SelD [bacterium]